MFIYGFGFFEYIPKLQCYDDSEDPIQYYQCTRRTACDDELKYKINYDDGNTIHNWITKLDLVCISNSEMGYFGALMLSGFFFGSLFLVRIGDIIGRKPVILLSMFLAIISLIGIALANTLTLLLVFIFVYGLTMPPQSFLMFVLMNELTTTDKEIVWSSVAMLFDATGMLILGTYFAYFKNMDGIIYGLSFIYALSFLFIWIYIPESPKFLWSKGNKDDKFRNAINRIASFNGY